MKKRIFNIVLTVFMFAVLLPVHALAANTNDEIQITNKGGVTVVSQHAAEEGISSLQLSLQVEPKDANVSFTFSENVAKIAEFRYHEDTGLLNIYLAGTEALFKDSDKLSVGTLVVKDPDGNDVTATVNVDKEALKYVYGTEMKTAEVPVPDQPVTINADQPANPSQPTDPSQPANPGDGNNGGSGSNTGTANNQGNTGTSGESGEKAASARTGDYTAILPYAALLLIAVIGIWYSRVSLRKKR